MADDLEVAKQGGILGALVGQPPPRTPSITAPDVVTGQRTDPLTMLDEALAGISDEVLGPKTPPKPPNIFYSPSLRRFSVGGFEFGEDEFDKAVASPKFASRQAGPKSPAPDWRPISDTEFSNYLANIGKDFTSSEAVLFGAQSLGESTLKGVGFLADILGAKETGEAFKKAGEAVGPSPAFETERGQSLAKSGFGGKVATVVLESIPSLALALAGGVGGAALGGRLAGALGTSLRGAQAGGSVAGIAASIFPTELGSTYDAIVQGGFDPDDPDVQTEALLTTLFKVGAQTLGPAVIVRGVSPALRQVARETVEKVSRSRLAQGLKAGTLEGLGEAAAQLADAIMFDPEVREKLDADGLSAALPLLLARHGEEALLAFTAGGLLGGALGAIFEVPAGEPVDLTKPPSEQPSGQSPESPAGPVPPAGGPVLSQLGLLSGGDTRAQLRQTTRIPTPQEPRALPAPQEPRALPTPQAAGALPSPQEPRALPGPQTLRALPAPLTPGVDLEAARPPALTPEAVQAALDNTRTALETFLRRQAEEDFPSNPMVPQLRKVLADLESKRLRSKKFEQEFEAALKQRAEIAARTAPTFDDYLAAERVWDAFRLVMSKDKRNPSPVTLDRLPPQQQLRWLQLVRANPHLVNALDTNNPAAFAVDKPAARELLNTFKELRRRASPTRSYSLFDVAAVLRDEAAQRRLEEIRRKAEEQRRKRSEAAKKAAATRAAKKAAEEKAKSKLRERIEARKAEKKQTRVQDEQEAAPKTPLRERVEAKKAEKAQAPAVAEQGREEAPQRAGVTVGRDRPKSKLRERVEARKAKKESANAVQEQGADAEAVRNEPKAGARVSGKDTTSREAAGARAETEGKEAAKGAEKAQGKDQALIPPSPLERREIIKDRLRTPTISQEDLIRAKARRRPPGPAMETLGKLFDDLHEALTDETTIVFGRPKKEKVDPQKIEKVLLDTYGESAVFIDQSLYDRLVKVKDGAIELTDLAEVLTLLDAIAYEPSLSGLQGLFETLLYWADVANKDTVSAEARRAAQAAVTKLLRRGQFRKVMERARHNYELNKGGRTNRTLRQILGQEPKRNVRPKGLPQEAEVEQPADDISLMKAEIETFIADFNAGLVQQITPQTRQRMNELWRSLRSRVKEEVQRAEAAVKESKGEKKLRAQRDLHLARKRALLLYGDQPLSAYIEASSPNFFRIERGPDGRRRIVAKPEGADPEGFFLDMTKPEKPLSPEKVEAEAKKFIKKLKLDKELDLIVERTPGELNDVAGKRFYEALIRSIGNLNDIKSALGASVGNTIILFSDNIPSVEMLHSAIVHEVIGHFGLRRLAGKQLDALLEEVYEKSPAVRAEVDAAVATRGLDKLEAIEEYLAELAVVMDTNLLHRVWDKIQQVLNKFGVRWGDEAARYVVRLARRYARAKSVKEKDAVGLFSLKRMGASIRYMEMGGDDPPARLMRAKSVYDIGLLTGAMTADLGWTGKDLLARVDDIKDFYERLKADALSLTSYRAKLNPGFEALYRTLLAANRMAMRVKNTANERMARYLNPAATVFGLKVGNGLTREQQMAVNKAMLAAQRRAAVGARNLIGTDDLFKIVAGQPLLNESYINKLRRAGRLTFNEMKNGFTYEVEVARALTDEELAKRVAEMEDKLEKARENDNQLEVSRLEREIESLKRRPIIFETRTEKFEGIKHLKPNSPEWIEYNNIRDTIEQVELELATAHVTAHQKLVEHTFDDLSALFEGGLSEEERGLLEEAVTIFTSLYLGDLSVGDFGEITFSDSAIANAEEFMVTFNKALLFKSGEADDKLATYFGDDPLPLRLIRDMRERFKPANETERFTVQHALRGLALDRMTLTQRHASAAQTIATGYVPLEREGRFQVRIDAINPETGEMVQLDRALASQLSYHQLDSEAEAKALAKAINEALSGEKTAPVRFFDRKSSQFKTAPVQLRATVSVAPTTISVLPELNLMEFMMGLRRFNIQLPPEKMEQVVVAMTDANSRARNRLLREFQPGFDPDLAKGITRHIEARAAIIAKTIYRPDLDHIMNLDSRSSKSLWFVNDPVTEAKLKAELEAARESGDYNRVVVAERAWSRWQYAKQQVKKRGVNRAMQFYAEGARLLAFVDQQRNLDESDFGTGDVASKIRLVTATAQLGGSIATAALNIVSLVTNTLPYLATVHPRSGFGGGFGLAKSTTELMKALRQVGTKGLLDNQYNRADFYRRVAGSPKMLRKLGLTADEAEFLANEIAEGVAIPALSNSLISYARGRIPDPALRTLVDGLMVSFNRTEQAARRAALLAAYRLMRNRLLAAGFKRVDAVKQAADFAVSAVEDTLGEYAVVNRPPLFRSGVFQFVYMYKIFPVMSVQLLANLPPRGKLLMLGMLTFAAGVHGIPFAADLEDLIDTISGRLGIRVADARLALTEWLDSISPGLAKVVMNGLINTAAPGDFGARVALDDMIPGSGIFIPGADVYREAISIGGPVVGLLEASFATMGGLGQWAAYQMGLSPNAKSLVGIARNAPATLVKTLADSIAYAQNGAIIDKRGYTISDEHVEAAIVARALGFYPTAASEQFQIAKTARRLAGIQREIGNQFYMNYIAAIRAGDRKGAIEVVREVQEWNKAVRGTGLEIRNFAANANRRLTEAQKLLAERVVRFAPVPARKRLRRFAEIMGY